MKRFHIGQSRYVVWLQYWGNFSGQNLESSLEIACCGYYTDLQCPWQSGSTIQSHSLQQKKKRLYEVILNHVILDSRHVGRKVITKLFEAQHHCHACYKGQLFRHASVLGISPGSTPLHLP